jgi:hypothetical protein
MVWSEIDFGLYKGDTADFAPEPGNLIDKFDSRQKGKIHFLSSASSPVVVSTHPPKLPDQL